MNLKTSLQISAVFPIVLAMMVSLSLVLRARHAGELQSDFRNTQNLTRAASELHAVTYNCLHHRDVQSQEQWMAKREALASALENMTADSIAGKIVIDRSKEAVKKLKDSFVEFCREPGDGSKLGSGIGVLLMTDTETLMQSSFALSKMTDANAEESQSNADMFFAVFIGVMGLLMAAATLSVSRDVVHRLQVLNQWVRTVSDGNLDAKIEVTGRNDEVGQVTRVFVEMTRKLSSAYGAMEKEIAEHKKAADALRDSNILLSNALEKLKRAQYQIIQQERLHVLEQIVRGVAHDFNNTLTPILGLSDFLLAYPKNLSNAEMVQESLKDINAAAQRAKDDVKKLSEFFHPAKGNSFQPVDMNELIAQTFHITDPRWKEQAKARGAKIDVHMEKGQIPPVAGDRSTLQEALANLILNAAEAMPRGGTITATTRADGASVIVEIKDTGEGMSHDVLVKCLEPFFSTKGVEGTGMGLTIVNNVIRRHGGTLDFKTEKGQGTTVILRLPAWNEDHREDSEDSLPVAITRALHILMIDDESWSRDIVSRMLSPDGHQIDVVASGEEGLEKLRIGSYDLVITDRAMPDMSGDDVAAEIRKKRPQMPIIMLTGFGDIMREEGDRPDSVDIVLSKPITSVALNQAISRLMHVKR